MSAPSDTLPLIAFDPGITGAFAVIDHDGVTVRDLPLAGGELDPAQLTRLIQRYHPTLAAIELVHSMPRQGVASTFKFGAAYGTLLGVLGALAIPTLRIRPNVWKKHFHLTGKPKDASRALAIRLFPTCTSLTRKKDHGRAEALLLARYVLENPPRSV